MDDKDLYAGLIRLHVLHHAVDEGEVYGLGMIEELGKHGYRLSAGTLYPILHGLERKDYLTSAVERVGARSRRVYRATPAGAQALASAKQRVWELFGELFEPRSAHSSQRHGDASSKAASARSQTRAREETKHVRQRSSPSTTMKPARKGRS